MPIDDDEDDDDGDNDDDGDDDDDDDDNNDDNDDEDEDDDNPCFPCLPGSCLSCALSLDCCLLLVCLLFSYRFACDLCMPWSLTHAFPFMSATV